MTNTNPARRPQPVLIAMSVLAALQILVGAAAFTQTVPAPWAGLAIAGVAAIQAGVAFYVRGQVTPLADPRDHHGIRLTREQPF